MLGFGIKQTTATTGTGNLTLSSVASYPTFNDVFGIGPFFNYSLLDSNGAPIEAGIGHLSDATTLVRDFVRQTYSGGVYDSTSPAAVSITGTTTVIGSAGAGSLMGAGWNIDSASTGVSRWVYSACLQYTTANTKTLTANRIYYTPFLLVHSLDVASLGFSVSIAAAAGIIARVGIYSFKQNGYPGGLVSETGNVLVDSLGNKTAVITQRFYPAGWYVAAIISNGAPTVRAMNAGSSANMAVPSPFGLDGATPPIPIAFRDEDIAAGWTAMPTVAGATTTGRSVASEYTPALVMIPA